MTKPKSTKTSKPAVARTRKKSIIKKIGKFIYDTPEQPGFISALFLCVFGLVVAPQFFAGGMMSVIIPGVAIGVIFMLGLMSIIRVFQRIELSRYVRFVLRFFAIICAFIVLFWIDFPNSGQCAGLFGVQTDCVNNQRFLISIFIFNPLVLLLAHVMPIIGIINLLIDRKKL